MILLITVKIIHEGTTSLDIEKMSKYNDGKKPGYGHTLLVLSAGKNFTLIKDGKEYKAKTLSELRRKFQGYFIKTETWLKFCGVI